MRRKKATESSQRGAIGKVNGCSVATRNQKQEIAP